ncbi:MAG: hypothetical protein MHM6MM_006040 [Cercozoa sp. M6MM]
MLPYTVVLLVCGMLAGVISDAFRGASDSKGAVRLAESFDPHLLLYIFIPALIFESSFATSFHVLRREFGSAVILAGPGVLVNSVLTAALFSTFSYGWSWSEAWLAAAIISATDPVAVVALLRELGASKRLATLIEAESLLNDGIAFVLYTILLEIVTGREGASFGTVVGTFCQLTIGGVSLGITLGLLTVYWLIHVFSNFAVETVITLSAAGLGVSGILSVVLLGLVVSRYKSAISPSIEGDVHSFWEMVSYIANTVIFVISGVIIESKIFTADITGTDAGLLVLLYLGIHVARAITIALFYPMLKRIGYGIEWREATVLTAGGLRGAISLALALLTEGETSLEQTYRNKVVFHVSGIVCLTLLLNGIGIRQVLAKLGMTRMKTESVVVFRQAMHHLRNESQALLSTLVSDKYYSGAKWDQVRKALPCYADVCLKLAPVQRRRIEQVAGMSLDERSQAVRTLRRTMTRRLSADTMASLGLTPETVSRLADAYRSHRSRSKSRRSKSLASKSTAESELLQPNEQLLLYEVVQRFLSSMKASYFQQYEEGVVTRRAFDALVEAADTALDENSLERNLEVLRPHVRAPRWLKAMYTTSFAPLRAVSHVLLTARLLYAVELIIAFLQASERLSQLIETVPELSDLPQVKSALSAQHRVEASAREAWLDIQSSFPEIYVEIQTQHAISLILHAEKHTISELAALGVLEEGEAKTMDETVRERLHSQQRQSVSVFEGNAQACRVMLKKCLNPELDLIEAGESVRILEELAWVAAMSEDEKKKLRNATTRLLFSKHEVLFRVGEQPDGILLLVRGVTSHIKHNQPLDTQGRGAVLAMWGFLTEQPQMSEVRARTLVEALFISGRVLRHLKRHNDTVAGEMWRAAGADLMKVFFAGQFPGHNALSLGRLCIDADVCTLQPGEQIILERVALLLEGAIDVEVASPVAGLEGLAQSATRAIKHRIHAPAILLPSSTPYYAPVRHIPTIGELGRQGSDMLTVPENSQSGNSSTHATSVSSIAPEVDEETALVLETGMPSSTASTQQERVDTRHAREPSISVVDRRVRRNVHSHKVAHVHKAARSKPRQDAGVTTRRHDLHQCTSQLGITRSEESSEEASVASSFSVSVLSAPAHIGGALEEASSSPSVNRVRRQMSAIESNKLATETSGRDSRGLEKPFSFIVPLQQRDSITRAPAERTAMLEKLKPPVLLIFQTTSLTRERARIRHPPMGAGVFNATGRRGSVLTGPEAEPRPRAGSVGVVSTPSVLESAGERLDLEARVPSLPEERFPPPSPPFPSSPSSPSLRVPFLRRLSNAVSNRMRRTGEIPLRKAEPVGRFGLSDKELAHSELEIALRKRALHNLLTRRQTLAATTGDFADESTIAARSAESAELRRGTIADLTSQQLGLAWDMPRRRSSVILPRSDEGASSYVSSSFQYPTMPPLTPRSRSPSLQRQSPLERVRPSTPSELARSLSVRTPVPPTSPQLTAQRSMRGTSICSTRFDDARRASLDRMTSRVTQRRMLPQRKRQKRRTVSDIFDMPRRTARRGSAEGTVSDNQSALARVDAELNDLDIGSSSNERGRNVAS